MEIPFKTIDEPLFNFLSWWARTLQEIAYDAQKKLGITPLTRWTLYAGRPGCTLVRPSEPSGAKKPDQDTESRISQPTPVETVLPGTVTRGATVDIVISEDLAWCARLTFPVGAKRRIRQAVRNRLDKESPVLVEQILFGLGGARVSNQKYTIDAVLVRKADVDEITSRVESAGARVGRISASKDGRSILLPATRPFSISGRLRTAKAGLTGAGLCLIAVSVLLYSMRLDHEIETMSAAVHAEQLLFHENLSMLEEKRDRNRILQELRPVFVAPDAASVLSAVTANLPSDVWLVEFRLSTSQVELEGFAEHPPGVAMLLQELPLFPKASLLWTRPNDQPGAAQRFRLTATVQFQ